MSLDFVAFVVPGSMLPLACPGLKRLLDELSERCGRQLAGTVYADSLRSEALVAHLQLYQLGYEAGFGGLTEESLIVRYTNSVELDQYLMTLEGAARRGIADKSLSWGSPYGPSMDDLSPRRRLVELLPEEKDEMDPERLFPGEDLVEVPGTIDDPFLAAASRADGVAFARELQDASRLLLRASARDAHDWFHALGSETCGRLRVLGVPEFGELCPASLHVYRAVLGVDDRRIPRRCLWALGKLGGAWPPRLADLAQLGADDGPTELPELPDAPHAAVLLDGLEVDAQRRLVWRFPRIDNQRDAPSAPRATVPMCAERGAGGAELTVLAEGWQELGRAVTDPPEHDFSRSCFGRKDTLSELRPAGSRGQPVSKHSLPKLGPTTTYRGFLFLLELPQVPPLLGHPGQLALARAEFVPLVVELLAGAPGSFHAESAPRDEDGRASIGGSQGVARDLARRVLTGVLEQFCPWPGSSLTPRPDQPKPTWEEGSEAVLKALRTLGTASVGEKPPSVLSLLRVLSRRLRTNDIEAWPLDIVEGWGFRFRTPDHEWLQGEVVRGFPGTSPLFRWDKEPEPWTWGFSCGDIRGRLRPED